MDTPAGQIRNSIVDLLEDIPLGHQCVQVELAPFIPLDKGGEIAVRATQAAAAGAHSTCTAIGHAPTVQMCFIFPSRPRAPILSRLPRTRATAQRLLVPTRPAPP